MNKNLRATAMDSVVELNPKIKRGRSTFNLQIKDYTSFNVGDLVPIGGFTEVLAGDTFNINLDIFLRMTSTLYRPPMDNLHMDVYAFFVPFRFLDDGWTQIQGESTQPWAAPSASCSMLRIPASTTISPHSLLCHLGVPSEASTGAGQTYDLNIYPVYTYFKIINDWFRDQNVEAEIAFDTTNNVYSLSAISTIRGSSIVSDDSLYRVAKYHDVFTSALPAPQKSNAPVTLPLGTLAPVIAKFDSSPTPNTKYGVGVTAQTGISSYDLSNGANYNGFITQDSTHAFVKGSLVADLSNATAATINELRLAFQLQKAYELDARSGTRYTEALEARFGVENPDLRLGRSELLGHYRFDLNMSEIMSNNGSTDRSSDSALLGDDAGVAYFQGVGVGSSKTGHSQHICVKSFTEHGIVMILGCIRPDLTYQQGLPKFFRKKERWDFYEPIFSNIGEVPIMKSELYAKVIPNNNDSVFGYQEAWYDYRYKMNNVSGCLCSSANQGYDIFHYALNFGSAPTLSPSFIQQSAASIDRCLVFESSTVDQFIMNAQGVIKATRVMPLFSVPGLIDHF